MSLKENFDLAAKNVQKLPKRPANEELLALYSLFKQATEGDVKGSRPGMLDVVGRRKYDAWAGIKGMAADDAMKKYIDLVQALENRHS